MVIVDTSPRKPNTVAALMNLVSKSPHGRMSYVSGSVGKSPRFIGPFKILARFGAVAYRLELSDGLNGIHNTFHISQLQKCLADVSAHVPLQDVEIDSNLNYVEKTIEIQGFKTRKLRNKEIKQLLGKWQHRKGSNLTWELEDEMWNHYPHLFGTNQEGKRKELATTSHHAPKGG